MNRMLPTCLFGKALWLSLSAGVTLSACCCSGIQVYVARKASGARSDSALSRGTDRHVKDLPVPSAPRIVLFLDGLIALSVRHGDTSCEADIIKNADNHALFVWLLEFSPRYPPPRCYMNPLGDISIDIGASSSAGGLQLWEPNGTHFKRKGQGNDPYDFQWILDLEGKECYDDKVDIDKDDGTQSAVRIINVGTGLLFAALVSPNELKESRNHGAAKVLGHVGTCIGALFHFDSTAHLRVGNDNIDLQPNNDTTYVIVVSHSQYSSGKATGAPLRDDAAYYEHLVKGRSHGCRRIQFGATPMQIEAGHPPDCENVRSQRALPIQSQGQSITVLVNITNFLLGAHILHLPNAICFTAQMSKTNLSNAP
jgi:hypothetical protein